MLHGYKSNLYWKWQGMKKRSKKPLENGYKYEISMCEGWNNYESFKVWALSNGYEVGLTLERIEVDKGYHPNNCKWATWYEQARNKTDTLYIEYMGISKCLADWTEELGLHYGTTHSRLQRGWDVVRAFETSTKESKKQAVRGRARNEKGRYVK